MRKCGYCGMQYIEPDEYGCCPRCGAPPPVSGDQYPRILDALVDYPLQIKDMNKGDTMYSVPWAYDEEDGSLDISITMTEEPTDAATMEITRLGSSKFVIKRESDTKHKNVRRVKRVDKYE